MPRELWIEVTKAERESHQTPLPVISFNLQKMQLGLTRATYPDDCGREERQIRLLCPAVTSPHGESWVQGSMSAGDWGTAWGCGLVVWGDRAGFSGLLTNAAFASGSPQVLLPPTVCRGQYGRGILRTCVFVFFPCFCFLFLCHASVQSTVYL